MKNCSASLITKENANQNQNDVSLHIWQNGYYQNDKKEQALAKVYGGWGEGNTCALLVGM